MSDSIFQVELPFVDSDEDLGKIKNIYTKYDDYFIASGCCKERRELFDKLWIKFKPYADTHFLDQIKTNFHQRSWEMYIGNVLLEKKFVINSQDDGPDFTIDKMAYVECVAPTRGEAGRPDSVPEMFVAKKPEEIRVQDVPVDKMILRITQSIKDKALDQYEAWKKKPWFDSKTPFIIAINSGGLEHVDDPGMPNVIKALFGFQFMQINVKNGETSYSHRDIIEKSNKSTVSVNYFINPNFSFISGVLFSDKTVLNHPENIGDDCIFVNNPFAENIVDEKIVNSFKNWTADVKISLKKNY